MTPSPADVVSAGEGQGGGVGQVGVEPTRSFEQRIFIPL